MLTALEVCTLVGGTGLEEVHESGSFDLTPTKS
jgi:hypothetical protein